jgi:hypothetical protein
MSRFAHDSRSAGRGDFLRTSQTTLAEPVAHFDVRQGGTGERTGRCAVPQNAMGDL